MITRRALLAALAGGVSGVPGAGLAQPAGRVARIGWLGGPTRETAQPFVRPFLEGLKDVGWVEGQNIVIEWRFAGGRADHLPGLAAELVQLGVELIVVPSTPTALAARNATKTIPLITVAGNDPVGLGLVASLARPGGNVTGLTVTLGPEMAGKQLELLKGTVAKASRVAALWNPATPGNALALREAEIAVVGDVMFVTHRRRLAELAATHRLPAMYSQRDYVDDGGLISYGANIRDNFRRAATYVARSASPSRRRCCSGPTR